jgi:hypothetical protein
MSTKLESILPAKGFLGLERIVRRLIAEDGFENHDIAMRSIAEYERFFLIAAQHSDDPHVPSHRVDMVWQRHMLDTVAYAEDCARWAGAYLHRVDAVPPDAYEQTLNLLGPYDPEIWNWPGSASISAYRAGPITPRELQGSLEEEDFSDVLARVRYSLLHKPSTPAWVADARELLESDPMLAMEEYRRFLGLLMTEAEAITPSKLVDEFWHQHVLDSRNYAHFCSRMAGRYLHHIPNYEKPHGFHAPAFRRTHALYRKRFGIDPPGRIWTHMGESGGCNSCSSEPPPLYIIDKPKHMCAELRIGGIDPRHFESLHPVLANNGLPPEIWEALIQEINSVPRISWAKFSAIKANSPISWGLIIGILTIALGWFPPISLVILLGAIIYLRRWNRRAFDQARAAQIIAEFYPVFGKYGARLSLDRHGKAIHCFACSNPKDRLVVGKNASG